MAEVWYSGRTKAFNGTAWNDCCCSEGLGSPSGSRISLHPLAPCSTGSSYTRATILCSFTLCLQSVFRIHDILGWIRILLFSSLTFNLPAKNLFFFNTIFSAHYFLKVHLHHFSKIKSQKESQNIRNQGFSYYFCMMIEGSGSIPLTSGSGSWRPKNMWIRIRNTGLHYVSDPEHFARSGISDFSPHLLWQKHINFGNCFCLEF